MIIRAWGRLSTYRWVVGTYSYTDTDSDSDTDSDTDSDSDSDTGTDSDRDMVNIITPTGPFLLRCLNRLAYNTYEDTLMRQECRNY